MDEQDLYMTVEREACEELHFHSELELIYVVTGDVKLTVGSVSENLATGAILLVNPGVPHSIHSDSNTILCRVYCRGRLLEDSINRGTGAFVCDSTNDRARSYEGLRGILEELVYYEVFVPEGSRLKKMSLLYALVDQLVDGFFDEEKRSSSIATDEVRLGQIIHYVSLHFRGKVSLSEVAAEQFVSVSTLSRFFKKQTGMYFADYVNRTRAEYAAQQLIRSNNTITQIAVESGFSSLAMFNRIFREQFGCAPSDYRKAHAEERRRDEEERETIRTMLRMTERQPDALERTSRRVRRTESNNVLIRARGGGEYRKFWDKVVNAGTAHSLLKSKNQSQLLSMCQDLGFRYVRIWDVFSASMQITDGSRLRGFNFERLDVVLDFLISNRLIPFINLGLRPRVVGGHGEEIRNNMNAFASFKAWEATAGALAAHLVKRYGARAGEWIFELSFDEKYGNLPMFPESHDAMKNYARIYDSLYHIIKGYFPEASFGGASFDMIDGGKALRAFAESVKSSGNTPDYVSIVVYPYVQTGQADNSQMPKFFDDQYLIRQIDDANTLLAAFELKDTKLYVTEWGITRSNRNYINDSCFYAAYIANIVVSAFDKVDVLCFRRGLDMLGSDHDTYRLANGNGGLITERGIRKPAYFVFDFLNRLGNRLVDIGNGYIATLTEHGDHYILCYNYSRISNEYFLKDRSEDADSEIDDIVKYGQPREMSITIDGLRAERNYLISRRVVNDEMGSLLGLWSRIKYSDDIEEDDAEYARAMCRPHLERMQEPAKNGTVNIKITLQPSEITLLHIYEAKV